MRHHTGHTLIELLMVMLIAAILAGLALPGLGPLLHRHRLQNACEALLHSAYYARSQAISLGRSTKVGDKFATDINGISGAQSGKNNDIVTSDRQLDPRISMIIEKMGIYKNMSAKEIENWKVEILKDPPSVLDGIKTYYTENVEPLLKDRENILRSEIEKRKGQNASVFLYVSNAGRDSEDGTFKENQKLMAIDLDKRPGFKIYHGQVVQQMRPDQTPFPSPEKLFEEDKKSKLKM